MYWWASHGAAGVNFHTGDRVGGGDKSLPSRYAAFVTGTNGYDFRPLAYGMTMFSLGARGDFLPLEINPSPDSSLKIYALLAQGTNLSVTIINLAHDANASTLKVEIKIKEPFRPVIASAMALQSPNHDAAAQNGITLGGKSINADGSWNGGWHDLDVSPSANSLAVEIPPLSATLLRVQLKK
jgi:hypothetical protein